MQAKPVLAARLEELQHQELNLDPETTDTLVVSAGAAEPLHALLATLGEVATCEPVAARSSAEGPGLGPGAVQVDAEAAFTVVLRDRAGEPVAVPPGALAAVLRVAAPEGGPAVTVAVAEAEGGGGGAVAGAVAAGADGGPAAAGGGATVRCSYTPTAAGDLSIAVTVLGAHVPGSPFRVPVVAEGLVADHSAILDAPMAATLGGMLGAGRMWRARRLCTSASRAAHVADFKREVKDRSGQRTLVVIREANTGYVFGGYVHGPYGNSSAWKPASPENFVFTLGNVTGSPVKLGPDEPRHGNGHYEHANRGICMGDGHDLRVSSGSSYCTPGTYKQVAPGYTAPGPVDDKLLAGVYTFTLSQIEVFTVE